jgi:hypothetical protein
MNRPQSCDTAGGRVGPKLCRSARIWSPCWPTVGLGPGSATGVAENTAAEAIVTRAVDHFGSLDAAISAAGTMGEAANVRGSTHCRRRTEGRRPKQHCR